MGSLGRMKWFLLASVVALLGLLALPDKGEVADAHALGESAPAVTRIEVRTEAPPAVDPEELRAHVAGLSWSRDPFSPPVGIQAPVAPRAPTGPSIPALKGIAGVAGSRVAIVGSEIVEVGDRLPDGSIVRAIDEHTVTLEVDGVDTVLTLTEES